MSHCLVTGGCGFIGGHLVQRLYEDGHTVTVVDTNASRFSCLPVASRRCYNLDIARMQAIPGDKPDVVFHLAAVSRTVPAMADPCACIRTNVLGTCRVLEAARKADVPRVVVSSSNVVLAGATAYRDSKKAVEDLCETYVKLYGQSVIALRYSNVYGPGIPRGDDAVFAKLRDDYAAHGHATVTGNGEQTRDFTHVHDIVRGNILAWQHPEVTGVVDLCTGVQTSINAACGMLDIPVQYTEERPGDVKQMYQNPAVAENLLEWRAAIEISEGLKDIWR